MPNLLKIGRTVRDEQLRSYSIFCKFQNYGGRPSWITNFEILGPPACSGCGVDDAHQIGGVKMKLLAKFGENRTNRFEVIQFLAHLSFSST